MKISYRGSVLFLFVCFLFIGRAVGNNLPGENIESMVQSYLNKADNCFIAYNPDKAKIYLDSASLYKSELNDPEILGFLYSLFGCYFNMKFNELEAYTNYYKAIEYYEKAGKKNLLLPIYHNLAFSYSQKNDAESLKKIIDKMLPLALTENKNADLIDTYRIIAFYYNILYEKEKKDVFLDSAIYYDKQAVVIFEKTPAPNDIRPEEIAYNYIDLASNLIGKEYIHPDTAGIYLAKAEKLSAPNDTSMILNLYWVKGLIACKREEFEKAKQLFNDQLALLKQLDKGDPLQMYAGIYQKLSEISEKQKDYSMALEYERKRIDYLNQIHDVQKYKIVSELGTKYEVRKNEQKITQLTQLAKYQKNMNRLYLFISILFFITICILISWFRLKKKSNETQLALVHSEKNEALLHIKFKEEQLEKAELEKYEVLLDNHFKKEQISDMDVNLKELKKEQYQLNTLIDDYAAKLKDYEKRKSEGFLFKTGDPFNSNVLQELYDLIGKKIKDVRKQKEYRENLTTVDDLFFQHMKEYAKKRLSELEIKRCTAFLIGMDAPDIAECFSVEQRSIHQAHYRLKAKFGVDQGSDLNRFLKQLLYK